MVPFYLKGQRFGWQIEQRDVGITHLLADGVEHTIRNEDVGLLYVVDWKNGDRLEPPPAADDDDDNEND